jgi:glycosyltransferase involved in cell wall biosynthesis
MTHSEVSIIMPVYNSENYLAIAIESILKQTFTDFELILINDGSTDNSGMICDEYSKNDSRIRVIHQKNEGICNARNTGLKAAKGYYIAFCDHDDEYCLNLLIENINLAKQYDADVVKFGANFYTIKDNTIIKTQKRFFLHVASYTYDILKESYFSLRNQDALSCVWDGIFKKSFLDKNSLFFDESFTCGGEDIDFMNRCLLKSKMFVTNQGIYYNHYIRQKFSTSSKFSQKKIDTCKMFPIKLLEYTKELDIGIESYKKEYTIFIIREVISPFLFYLSRKGCDWKLNEKINILREVLSADYIFEWVKTMNYLCIYHESKRYGVLHYLFFHKCFYLCLLLFKYKFRD